jgi:hypothetical protein
MLIDFKKNDTPITEVIILDEVNEEITEFREFILKTQDFDYKFTAVGDCCSVSNFFKYEDYDYNSLIGKKIIGFKEIDIPDDYDLKKLNIDEDEDDSTVSPHLYEMSFKDTEDTFKFILVNFSNGYYEGWVEVSETDNNINLIIIIGLPASGKSTYYENNLSKHDFKLYDDFISNFYDSDLIDDIKAKKKLCLIDPRLCDFNLFEKIMNGIKEYIDVSTMKLLLFPNDKLKSIRYSKQRHNKEVSATINKYSAIYQPANYINYPHKIIK